MKAEKSRKINHGYLIFKYRKEMAVGKTKV